MHLFERTEPIDFLSLTMPTFSTATAIQVFLISVLARCIYLRYFHPLSSYPGPFVASFTNLW